MRPPAVFCGRVFYLQGCGMDEFWAGFEKRAEDIIEKWQEQSGKKKEKKDRLEVDPLTLSSSFTPDTYWRSWP
jgi:hypothetical protein